MTAAFRPDAATRPTRRGDLPAVVGRLWGGVELLAKSALILAVAVMVVVTLAQVFWRYVFHDPLIWSEELARYTFVWIGYLSGWLAWKHRAHIALDAVGYIPSRALQSWSARLVELLVLGFCAYSFATSLSLLELTNDQPSAILEIPMSWVYGGYSAMALLIAGDILVGWLAALTGGRAAA